jgi:hypothetical protein
MTVCGRSGREFVADVSVGVKSRVQRSFVGSVPGRTTPRPSGRLSVRLGRCGTLLVWRGEGARLHGSVRISRSCGGARGRACPYLGMRRRAGCTRRLPELRRRRRSRSGRRDRVGLRPHGKYRSRSMYFVDLTCTRRKWP